MKGKAFLARRLAGMLLNEWIPFSMSTNGPFDLKRTIESGQSSFPTPQSDKLGRYYLVFDLESKGKKVITRFYQKGAKLHGEMVSPMEELTEAQIKEAKKKIRLTLGLQFNLREFYATYKDDPIAPAFQFCTGLKLTRAYDLFESLISSILTQNSSVWKWVGQVRKLKELAGEKFPMEHFMIYSFPSPQNLFRLKYRIKEAKLGYREEYVLKAIEEIATYQIRLDKLRTLSTDKARKILLKIKGIGPKVADMFLLYGLGKSDVPPIDIWIQRGVSSIFFKGKEVSLDVCRTKLVEHYGKWAGLAQLYIYDWIRQKKSIS